MQYLRLQRAPNDGHQRTHDCAEPRAKGPGSASLAARPGGCACAPCGLRPAAPFEVGESRTHLRTQATGHETTGHPATGAAQGSEAPDP